jgi:serine phosphatase RsbU (regulator of sigma subunit)/putative methionine-R-sulfoxide reductase with GAF domain/anti-sigma regulatory factor (Ser/Thr protein kinase)
VNEILDTPGDPAVERLRRLESIADVALAHVGLEAMMPELLDRVQAALDVDTVAVLLLDPDRNELVARAAKGIEEEVEQGVRIPVGRGFAGRVAIERRPIAIDDVEHSEVLNPLLRQKGIHSLLGVPLLVEGDVLGVLHVGSLTPREFGAEDAAVLELAAGRIGPAIEHARLYDAERDARRHAEAALVELRALQELADAALSHLDLDEMLGELLDRLRDALHADTAAILLFDEESNELVARAARGLEEEVERGVRIPVGRGFAGRIAAERRVVSIADLSRAEVVNPILREKGLVSLLGAPLMAAGQFRGVVHIGTLSARAFTDADARLLHLAADRIAMALDHARLAAERSAMLTLQQSLLPQALPEIPGLALAARYRPGEGGLVGGDWYDAVPLPGGGVALAMGDVVSRGIRAAGVMGQVRHALRTFALEGEEPERLVERLAGLVRSLERREMVTLAYVTVDPDARELRYVSAGHPPPLVVEDGVPRFLERSRGAPLGAIAHPRYVEASEPIATDALIVLYTDGLVERRDRPLADGLERLAVAAAAAGPDPETVCQTLTAALVDENNRDDVALIVARVSSQRTGRFELSLPAITSSLAALRRSLRQWLGDNGGSDDDVLEVLIAVGEAAGNAVEHAYGPGDATFDVSGTISGGMLEIAVRDYGQWRAPRGQNRGRGTMLMQQLMDDFEVRTTADGTEVRMRRELGGGSRA